jgi:glycosyltransferase involved in cell wall biosynthesis
MPVRNGKDFIFEALDSILKQDFTNFEVIVIDDGSNDFPYKSLEDYDPRITVIRLEGLGVSHARNIGMQHSLGRFIAFLDADDVWFPGKLSAQISCFERHPEAGIIFGTFTRWLQKPDGSFVPTKELVQDCAGVTECDSDRSGWIYTKLLMGMLVGMNTAIIRREIYQRLGGFDETMKIGEDYEFWLRASRITKMYSLKAAVALYRIHSNSAMHNLSEDNHLATLLKIAKYRWGLSDPAGNSVSSESFRKRCGRSEFDHGYLHYKNGSPKIARLAFIKSMEWGFHRRLSIAYIIYTTWQTILGSITSDGNRDT